MHLKVMESFYTIQGEGFHQGRAAYFIRLGGCDVGCVWCDVKDSWDAEKHPAFTVNEIVAEAAKYPGRMAVVTGGEPLMHDCNELTQALHQQGFENNIETSGSSPMSGDWDWICLSPKKFKAPLPEIMPLANELKVVVLINRISTGPKNMRHRYHRNANCICNRNGNKASLVTPMIIDYIKDHPKWELSLQIHKYINVP